jgi:uncharacterized protein (DUF697 family)
VLVKVIRWVVVTVGKWVTRIVCEIVNIVLDIIGGNFEATRVTKSINFKTK